MSVYFKFKSAKDFDSLDIDGHFIAVSALKDRIVEHKGLGPDSDVKVFDAQTEEGRSSDERGTARHVFLPV